MPKDRFEWIEEWHAQEERKYLVGVVSFKELSENSWWKENGVSLILTPDPLIEDVEIRKLKKKAWTWPASWPDIPVLVCVYESKKVCHPGRLFFLYPTFAAITEKHAGIISCNYGYE